MFASTAFAQAPDTIGGMVYHETSYPLQDYVQGGDLKSTTSVTSLRYDGTYTTMFKVVSRFAWSAGEPDPKQILRSDNGTYAYVKTGAGTATLTLTSTVGSGATERTLGFDSATSGILIGALYPGGTGGGFSLASTGEAPVVNFSSRGSASSGKPLILGFYVSGSSRLVLVRGVGPTLAQFGVADAADDTTIEIVPSQPPSGDAIALGPWNDDWEVNTNNFVSLVTGAVPPAETVGAFTGAFALPAGSKDAALVVELQAGAYTAIIRTKSETPAEVLGEVYIVP
jgi:hypothetical protein